MEMKKENFGLEPSSSAGGPPVAGVEARRHRVRPRPPQILQRQPQRQRVCGQAQHPLGIGQAAVVLETNELWNVLVS